MAERMVELIARTLRDEIHVPACEHVIANDAWDEACTDCREPEVRRVAELVVRALADAGHLLPLDA